MKDPLSVAFGRRGGRARGAKGFALKSAAERAAVARAAAHARWHRKPAAAKPPKLAAKSDAYDAIWKRELPLYQYCADSIQAANQINWAGDLSLVRTYHGLRPLPDKTVFEIVVKERATRPTPTAPQKAPRLELIESPDVTMEFENILEDGYRVHRFKFPEGWSLKQNGEAPLSFRLRSTVEKAFAIREKEIAAAKASIHVGDAVSAVGFRVPHPMFTLALSVEFPEGYTPEEWCEPWAFSSDAKTLVAGESVLEKGICRGHTFTPDGNSAILIATDVRPGFTFTIRWRPRSPRQHRLLEKKAGKGRKK